MTAPAVTAPVRATGSTVRAQMLMVWPSTSTCDLRLCTKRTALEPGTCLLTVGCLVPPSPVGSASDVAVTSPDVIRCHGMSQGDRERSR